MAQTLQAGAAQTDITPLLGAFLTGTFSRRPAEDIDDPLYSKAVVIDNGEARVGIVVLDLIAVPRDVVQRIRALVTEHVGIPPEHVMIACTHTHTGPQTRLGGREPRDEAYIDWLVHRVSDSVRLAVRRLQPARLAWGEGEQHDISFCRRYLMKDGTVRTNPGYNSEILRPVSPIDPTVGVLYIEDLQGNPLCVVTRFSLHYVGTDNSLAVSADYYGHFANVMRRHLGDKVVPMLLNGTSGQINNINPLAPPRKTRGHAQALRVAKALAGEVMKVIYRLEPAQECVLGGASTMARLPCKNVTDEDRKIAEQILAGSDPRPNEGPFSFVVGQPIPASMRPHYARLVRDMPAYMEGEVQALRIGASGWVGLPGEIFVETGFEIVEASPAAHTFVVGLANDSLGYIPTDRALTEEGGYETWGRAGVGAAAALRDASVSLLRELFQP